jgi:hypothetical protein
MTLDKTELIFFLRMTWLKQILSFIDITLQ